jgi:hypothetical protein
MAEIPLTWRLRARPYRRGHASAPAATSLSEIPGPVVVGGVGGSGTRVVEEMMRRLHVYTGADLNSAGDNRWFTFLCKLPRWDLDECGPGTEVAQALATLDRAMTGRLDGGDEDVTTIRNALRRCRHWWRRDRLVDERPPRWLRQRVVTLLRSPQAQPAAPSLWGWKEPNSHLFIRHLHQHFGDRLRYVHVIRNGLDMAQSRNQLQLPRWGQAFGVARPSAAPSPAASLDYWIRANEAAIEGGGALPPGAFLLLNYDDLCADPAPAVERFAEFLRLDPTPRVRQELAAIPRVNVTTPRVDYDAEKVFGGDRLARVEALGFPLRHAPGPSVP